VVIAKREAALKSRLVQTIKLRLPSFVLFRHEDVRTAGIPDISLTGNKFDSWWECKHGTPNFPSTHLQELRMKQLAVQGFARYVIWMEEADGSLKRTLIVEPKHLYDLTPEYECNGFSIEFVVEYMKQVHR